NRVVLVGRLTKDPDLRYTPNDAAVANFTIAINRPFKNQHGENDADFINCVVWRKAAENFANYMRKGSQIGVDGRLQRRTYENEEGKTLFVTEVVADNVQFLESKGSRNSDGGEYSQQNAYQKQQSPNQSKQQASAQEKSRPFESSGEQVNISDDDLPF